MPGHTTGAGSSNPVDRVFPHPIPKDGAADFRDRRDEMATIQSVLSQAARKPLLIRGERCIGKTSLLNRVRKWLETPPQSATFRAITIEPGGIASWQEFSQELWDGVLVCIEGSGLELPARFRAAREARTFGQFLADLRKLIAYLPGVTYVVFLDELDKITRHCDSLQQTKILSLIRQIVEADDAPLAFVISVLRGIPGQEGLGSPLAVQEVGLAPMGREDTLELAEGLLAGCCGLSAEAGDWLWRYTGGHPYFVKLLLALAWDQLLGTNPPDVLTSGDLQRFLCGASAGRRKQAGEVLQNVYREYLNDSEREVLLRLADQRDGRLPAHALDSAPGRLKTAAEELTARHYSRAEADGSYAWRVEWMRDWLTGWSEYASESERLCGTKVGQALPQQPAQAQSGILIDVPTQTVWVRGEVVAGLSALEYRALVLLTQRVGEVVSRDELAAGIYPDDACCASDQAMSALVYRLRKALHQKGQPSHIETVRSRGLRLRDSGFTKPPSVQ